MDITSILETVKEKVFSIKDKIIEFYEENKKLSYIILVLIVVILLCIILLLFLVPGSKKNDTAPMVQPLVLTEELKIPNSPELPESYTISRKTTSAWSDEEAEQWFTVPSQKEINALSQSNENMINELLGATP